MKSNLEKDMLEQTFKDIPSSCKCAFTSYPKICTYKFYFPLLTDK